MAFVFRYRFDAEQDIIADIKEFVVKLALFHANEIHLVLIGKMLRHTATMDSQILSSQVLGCVNLEDPARLFIWHPLVDF